MRWLFIRHGETQANVEKRIYGASHSPYTPRGEKQVEALVEVLKDRAIDRVYTSTSKRTLKIATKIQDIKGIPLYEEERLCEMNFGILEGMTQREAMDRYPDVYHHYMTSYDTYQIPQGECFMDFDRRVRTWLDHMKDQEGTIAVITHGGVMGTAITHLLGLASEERWHFSIVPGMILEIDYREGYGRLIAMGTFA